MRQMLYRFPSISAFFLILLSVFFTTNVACGQSQSVVQAISPQAIDEASRVALRGNIHPLALPRNDHGAVPDNMPAARMMLILKRSPQQEFNLQSYLHEVQDASSANYRKFVTPEEFGRRFGISDADLDKVQMWLQEQGLTVNKVNKGRTAIEFSGTVGQLQQTFSTSIHRYLIDNVEHWANVSDPRIPVALSPVVAGVARLNDFKPRPHLIKGPSGRWNPELSRFAPDLTITSGASKYLFVGPGDAATIYDAPNSLNTNFVSGQTQYDGTGVTIGVAGDTWLNFSDDINYRSLFGLPSNHLTIVYDGNELNMNENQDQTEALLDTEVAGALAPGANVILYTAGDTQFQSGILLAIYRAIDDNKVNILSVSYGECEASLGAAGNLQILNAWEQAAAQGITVVVSSGDSGSAGCDNPNSETVATQGLAVNGLASTPYNIAVGGTDYDALSNSFSTYVSSANSSNYTSALSYIPENSWNNSTQANSTLANNSVYKDSSGNTNIVAGGGGASSLGNGGLSGYPKPLWQQGFSLSNTDTVRDLPDVSLLAANGQYGALWAICGDNECSGSNQTISGVGGTSASTPAFAGILALVNQKIGASTRLGQANWVLYKLAQTNPSAFHQITSGNNSVYCTALSPNCGTNNFLTGYNTGYGYNLATGLGSVDITKLVNDWASVSFTSTSTSLSLDKTSFTHGANVNITAGVNPSAATGYVTIVNYVSQAQATTNGSPTLLPLIGGSASASYNQFPGGTYYVYASYAGDGTYSGSVSSPVQVNVSPENSILQLSVYYINSNSHLVSAAGATIPLGATIIVDAQPIGASQAGAVKLVTNATGTVGFDDLMPPAGGGIPLDSTGNAVINNYVAFAGAHSISATYSGDLSYNSSTAAGVNFTVSKAPTTISMATNAASISSEFAIFTATVQTNLPVNGISGTGTITITDLTNNTVLGSGPPDSIQCTNKTMLCFNFGIDVYVTQLAMGANSIVATYSGDSNYVGSGPSAPITVTCTAGCSNGTGQTIYLTFYTSTPSSGILSPGETRTTPVGVTSDGGFTGAVNLTCSVSGTNNSDQHIPTCSFSPNPVQVPSNLSGSTTLTINTTAATTSVLRYPTNRPWCVGGTALATLLLLGIPAKQFRRRILMCVLIICMATGWIAGCGGGGSSGVNGGGGGNSGTPGTTADVYTVTFHAADVATGTVTAEDYFNFTVN
jgi:hypothetical protein